MSDGYEGPTNGGMAFPGRIPIGKLDTRFAYFGGMSLRDYFAAKALCIRFGSAGTTASVEVMARHCYAMADAMLAAREVQS